MTKQKINRDHRITYKKKMKLNLGIHGHTVDKSVQKKDIRTKSGLKQGTKWTKLCQKQGTSGLNENQTRAWPQARSKKLWIALTFTFQINTCGSPTVLSYLIVHIVVASQASSLGPAPFARLWLLSEEANPVWRARGNSCSNRQIWVSAARAAADAAVGANDFSSLKMETKESPAGGHLLNFAQRGPGRERCRRCLQWGYSTNDNHMLVLQ